MDSDPNPRSKLEIRAEIAPRITFATHQCDVPVLIDLAIANLSDDEIENVTLHLSCEPRVLAERMWAVDRIAPRGEIRPRDRRVTIVGGFLSDLTERVRAEVRIELRNNGAVLAETTHSITALARNEWGGADFMPELLAAFVTPNDPAVARLLKEASRLLEQSGKRGSLEGYQSKSRTRSWEIVSGIWAAVSSRGLTYAEPPASFETGGQKIRLPSIIEEQGLATCLDTALLFAAAIEQAGLYPVVVFTRGHALAGAWLQPQSLPALTVDDVVEIRKAVDQKELVLFETTMAAAGHALPFAKAVAEARRQIDESNEANFIYAIDIRQARGRDIQPLSELTSPLKDQQKLGLTSDRVAPPIDQAPDLPAFDTETPEESAAQTPEERLERWKRSLLDLSKRNRLLNLKPSATAIPIFCPNTARLEDKIAAGKRIHIITPPVTRSSPGQVDEALYHLRTGDDRSVRFSEEALERDEIVANIEAKALEKGTIELYRKAKADLEEGGSNTLFLALGMLRWCSPGDPKCVFRAPLILLPVRLERKSAASKPYLTRHEDDPVFNLTLLQMLRQDFHVEIPEVAGELATDESGIDVRLIWDTVRARVREIPGFEVVEEVILSTFSFAKYLMWKDLAERTEMLKQSPFVRHLIDTPRDPYQSGAIFLAPREIDSRIDPAELMAPLNADSSQIVAIHASANTGDFVLEGPPGTGKSETIGNIIAHNIGMGRRVLFVSEKMAALDVVHRRLDEIGLGDFCLELHSAKANKKAVLDQLRTAWGNRSIQSTADWERSARSLADARSELNGLVDALHAPGPAGISPRSAIGRSLRFRDVHPLTLDWPRDPAGAGHAPSPEAFDRLLAIAKRAGQQFSQLHPDDFKAFSNVGYSDWSFAWQSDLAASADKLARATRDFDQNRRSFTSLAGFEFSADTLEHAAVLCEIAELLPACSATNLRFALEPSGVEAIERLESLTGKLSSYRSKRRLLSFDYKDSLIESCPVAEWIGERAIADSKLWPFKILARNKLRDSIRRHFGMTKKDVVNPEVDLDSLRELAELQREIRTDEASLGVGTPWRGLDTDQDRISNAVASGRRLREATNRIAGLSQDPGALRNRLSTLLCDERDSITEGHQIAASARSLIAAHEAVQQAIERFMTAARSDSNLMASGTRLEDLLSTTSGILEHEKRLNLWCSWIEARREAEGVGLGCLVDALALGTISPDQVVEAFRTAYCRWLAPILIDSRAALKKFSAVRHEDLIKTFREMDAALAKLSAEYIRAKLSAGIPSDRQKDVGPGFGFLSRELQKKMRHKPVRQLVAEMGDSLLSLTPCLMMSPLSVAQFLSAQEPSFDVVVFDEASQITVPDAIGAIARGRHCIVVGDPRQMPPTRFFEKDAEDDENEEARDLESILDEALAARVPHHRLTGHYRSRHESLICFSNHAYYDGSLVTYPSAVTKDTAVTWRRVDGIYAKGKSRTNPIEAKAVVEEVVRRLRDQSLNHLSIGVVTLNSEQQRLVEDLLDQERRADPDLERFFRDDVPEKVFVKNLETVQGDQRDIILLSIGYGPTEPGAKTMSMNFGPLNRVGGERRLNVAITRATTEVIVFSSFDPSMIDLTRTSAEAVKDLKHYIDFAARGPVALGEAITAIGGSHDYESDFEAAVAEGIRRLGWAVRTQVGVSKFRIDLAVVHPDEPGRFLAGIECDGATYHSSPSARDRDRVRHIILEQLGWRLVRIWSTDFFIDPQAAVASLDERLKSILETDRAEGRCVSTEETSAPREGQNSVAGAEVESVATSVGDVRDGAEQAFADIDDDEESVGEDDASVFGESVAAAGDSLDQAGYAQPGPRNFLETHGDRAQESRFAKMPASEVSISSSQFYEPQYQGTLRTIAEAIIDSEGPITFKRLTDRIARRHGFQRTGKQIKSTVWAACARLRSVSNTPDGHKVLWPAGVNPKTVVEFRGLRVGEEVREWRDVPYPEKLGLVNSVLRNGSSDVVRSVAESIGYNRVTESFRAEISAIVEALKIEKSKRS